MMIQSETALRDKLCVVLYQMCHLLHSIPGGIAVFVDYSKKYAGTSRHHRDEYVFIPV